MSIDAIGGVKKGKDGDFDATNYSDYSYRQMDVSVRHTDAAPVNKAAKSGKTGSEGSDEKEQDQGKDPAKSTIDSVMAEANQRMGKTRCEYSYDEPTKRVSIKVFDKDTNELIREVPPEKSLEMLQKMWELAGIIVDEKR